MTVTNARPQSDFRLRTAEVKRTALSAWDAGLQPHPAKEDGLKMPMSVPLVDDDGQSVYEVNPDGSVVMEAGKPKRRWGWKHLQHQRHTRADVEQLFTPPRMGLGIFTGVVSGNVVLFEFDDDLTYRRFLASAEALDLGDVVRRIEAGYVEDTPGGGVHWLVRVPKVRGNTKLAQRTKHPDEMQHENDRVKTLVETRENGGWAVLAPSFGKVHETGRPYVLRAGGFDAIADLTDDEQDQLWALAETFDEMPDVERFRAAKRVGRPVAADHPGDRPGDRFEREASWLDDILPGGWTVVGDHGDNLLIRRPGKSKGWSATISGRGNGVLYLFTSSAHPLESGACYSKFGAYAALEHGGDFKAAARALAERYGMKSTKPAQPKPDTPPGPPGDPGAAASSGGEDDDLPRINASIQDLRVITAQAWDAIRKANEAEPFMFRYGGLPVRVEHDDESRPILRELTIDHVRHLLARVAEFITYTKNGDDWQTKVVLPPLHVCRDVLVTPNPPLPILVRVTEAPIFGPDGTLRTEPGYDAGSRTYLAIPPDVRIPDVPDTPSAGDVERAKALILDDVLGDFPFVSDADEANIVGLGLEPFVRSMIAGPMPMHGVEASTPGSGKGLLVEAVLRPSCGRNIAAFPQAKDDDEWRKRLTSTFERGFPAIQIDNVNRPLDSGSLAMALTIGIWTERVLGTSKVISVPIKNSWALTANNPMYSTEMARRTVRTRIDPKVDRPQERDGWRHQELLTWVDDHRGELIWAFCVLVRSWLADGRPGFSGKALGSYERWSHVIGGILDHVGIEGFLANQGTFYDLADIEASAWRSFVASWWEEYGADEVSSSELFTLASGLDGFDLGAGNERSQKTRFGKLLGKQRDRVIGEYRVTPTGVRHKVQCWRLLPCGEEEPGDVGDVGGRFQPSAYAGARARTHAHMGLDVETYVNVPNVPREEETNGVAGPEIVDEAV